MSKNLNVSCSCGAFRGVLKNTTPKTTTHLMCFCKHCQAFVRHLGKTDSLVNELGGTDLLQVNPKNFEIQIGKEHLRALRLTPKGPLRWYASCCDTPICNSMKKPFPPFLSFMAGNILGTNADFGPVLLHTNDGDLNEEQRRDPRGRLAMSRIVARFLKLSLVSRLSGSFRASPLFDSETRLPISKPALLTAEERKAAYSE